MIERNVPEYRIPSFIGLPRSYEGDVTHESRLQDVALSVENSDFFGVPLLFNPKVGAAIMVFYWDRTLFHGCRRSSWREECRNTGTMSTNALNKSPLRNKFETDFAREIQLLEVLVAVSK